MKHEITKTGRKIIHGFRRRSLKRPREYNSWQHMKGRCYNPRHTKYKWYGLKGVAVCKRWIDSFEAFLADVGKAPSPIHTLDRKNPFGDYTPGNVKWSTPGEQMRNTRRAKKYRIAA